VSADTTSRPFRFAVQAYKAASAKAWRDLARKVEDLGYSTLHSADHVLDRGPAAQHVAPIASMATAAAVTETLRIGCRVFCVDYHVPASLAKELATLDLLSEGRLDLGIGAGWSEVEYRSMGLTFDEGPRRLRKLKEVVALLKAHFSGEELDCRGEFVNVTGYAGLPLPVQRPHPPFMIGGNRKGILSWAAREAEIVSFSNVPFVPVNDLGLTPEQEMLRRFGFVRGAAGHRLREIDIENSPYYTAVADKPDDALAAVAANFRVTAEGLLEHPNVLMGSADEIEERLFARREMYGVNYVTVQQDVFEAFAPIVARLTGK
jgi:probable F420-dependent oxidoreductase